MSSASPRDGCFGSPQHAQAHRRVLGSPQRGWGHRRVSVLDAVYVYDLGLSQT